MAGKRRYFPHSYLGILHVFTHGINLNFELACTKSCMRKSQSRNNHSPEIKAISETQHETTFAVPSFLTGELGIHCRQVFTLLPKAQLNTCW